MILLDLTLPTPEENLALDEALLLRSEREESAGRDGEALRFWESPAPFVVLGVAGRLRSDVRVEACRRDGVPVLRRISGGGTVLQGPGSLNFALVLSLARRPELRDIRRGYRRILEGVAGALGIAGAGLRGISDIALGDAKVSGNAQKRTRGALLHHGTILHGLDPAIVSRWLEEPADRPEYRGARRHEDFLGSVPIPPAELKRRLAEAWGAVPGGFEVPPLEGLIAEKYANPAWTERF